MLLLDLGSDAMNRRAPWFEAASESILRTAYMPTSRGAIVRMARCKRQQLDQIDCVTRLRFDLSLQFSSFGGVLEKKGDEGCSLSQFIRTLSLSYDDSLLRFRDLMRSVYEHQNSRAGL